MKAKIGAALLDPMCGSGTILAEGFLMAADRASRLIRKDFGFQSWSGFDAVILERLRLKGIQRRYDGFDSLPPIIGGDHFEQAFVFFITFNWNPRN